MKKETLRVIPFKNYVILAVVVLLTGLFLYYFCMWSQAYKDEKLNTKIMDKYMEVINYNELSDYLVETTNAIIYVSVLEDDKIREFEKKFRVAFKKNEIRNNILYMDITDQIKDNDIKKELNDKYSLNGISAIDVPVIMYIKNNQLVSIYSIKNNDYEIDGVKLYLDTINVNEEDDIDG